MAETPPPLPGRSPYGGRDPYRQRTPGITPPLPGGDNTGIARPWWEESGPVDNSGIEGFTYEQPGRLSWAKGIIDRARDVIPRRRGKGIDPDTFASLMVDDLPYDAPSNGDSGLDRSRFVYEPTLMERIMQYRPGKRAARLGALGVAGAIAAGALYVGALKDDGSAEEVASGDGTELIEDDTEKHGDKPEGDLGGVAVESDGETKTILVGSLFDNTSERAVNELVEESKKPAFAKQEVDIEGSKFVSNEFTPATKGSHFPDQVNSPERQELYFDMPYSERTDLFDMGAVCAGEDIMIPAVISHEAAELEKLFKPALNHSEYVNFVENIKNAETVHDIQSMVIELFADLGFATIHGEDGFERGVRFSADLGEFAGMSEKSEPGYTSPVEDPKLFASYIEEVTAGLRYIPAEMLQSFHTLSFVDSQYILLNRLNAVGAYGGNEIFMAGGYQSGRFTFVHEVMHAVHDDACQGFLGKDVDMEAAYYEALELIPEATEDREDDYRPFSTAYSTTEYVEMFAELSAGLIMNGLRTEDDLKDLSEGQRKAYLRLQELIVERMQVALPGTDVLAMLQLSRIYDFESKNLQTGQFGELRFDYSNSLRSLYEITELEVEDDVGGNISTEDILDSTKEPAVELRFSDDDAITIIEVLRLPDGRKVAMYDDHGSLAIAEAVNNYLLGSKSGGRAEGTTHRTYLKYGEGDQGFFDSSEVSNGVLEKEHAVMVVTIVNYSADSDLTLTDDIVDIGAVISE